MENKFTVAPWVDIFETEKNFVLLADMPGVPKEKLEITFEGGVLNIKGETDIDSPKGRKIIEEFKNVIYKRSFSFTGEIDSEKIEAELKNGTLFLKLPKREPAKKKIPIKTA